MFILVRMLPEASPFLEFIFLMVTFAQVFTNSYAFVPRACFIQLSTGHFLLRKICVCVCVFW